MVVEKAAGGSRDRLDHRMVSTRDSLKAFGRLYVQYEGVACRVSGRGVGSCCCKREIENMGFWPLGARVTHTVRRFWALRVATCVASAHRTHSHLTVTCFLAVSWLSPTPRDSVRLQQRQRHSPVPALLIGALVSDEFMFVEHMR